MAYLRFNEKSTKVLAVDFFNEDDVLEAPTTASYRIDDVDSGEAIVPLTALTAAATVEIEITPGQNAMRNAALPVEVHVLTVIYTYGSGRQSTDEYLFEVKNLLGVS